MSNNEANTPSGERIDDFTNRILNWIRSVDDGSPAPSVTAPAFNIRSIESDTEDDSNDNSNDNNDQDVQDSPNINVGDNGNRADSSATSSASGPNQGHSPFAERIIHSDKHGRFENAEYILSVRREGKSYLKLIEERLQERIDNRDHQPEGESTIEELILQGMNVAARRWYMHWAAKDFKKRLQKLEIQGAEERRDS